MRKHINKIKEKLTPGQKIWIKKQVAGFWDLLKFITLALIIVIPFRLFIAQPFVVSGDSMFPTFHSGQYLIVDELSYHMGKIHRGDVVIFRYPNNPSRYFIKRMIGLPGEKIVIQKGKITIFNKENPNGFQLNEPYIHEAFDADGNYDNTYEVSPDHYFVMGDNRNFSSDSRVWGLVPKELLIGRAYLRLLPFSTAGYLPGYYPETK